MKIRILPQELGNDDLMVANSLEEMYEKISIHFHEAFDNPGDELQEVKEDQFSFSSLAGDKSYSLFRDVVEQENPEVILVWGYNRECYLQAIIDRRA